MYDRGVDESNVNWDWLPFAEAFFSIKDREGRIVPYRANHIQRGMRADLLRGHRRTKAVKARRHGMTVGKLLPALVRMHTRSHYSVAVGSTDIPTAQKIVTTILEPVISNRNPFLDRYHSYDVVEREIRITIKGNPPIVNVMRISGLSKESFVVGIDLSEALMTEAGLIPEAGWEAWDALMPSVPDWGVASMEGTAYGIGSQFYQRYMKGDWLKQFYPWWTSELGMLRADSPALAGEDVEYLRRPYELTEREAGWKLGHGLTDDQLRFYRWKVHEFGPLVHQFYPSTVTEAFISGSIVQFPVQILQGMYDNPAPPREPEADVRARWVEMGWRSGMGDEAPGLRVFRLPEAGHRYSMGIDSSEGLEGPVADESCLTVLDAQTRQQACVLWGTYRPDVLASLADRIGRYYNQALIVPEVNGIGASVCQDLEHTHHYPDLFRHGPDEKVGFFMTPARKEQAFGAVSKALEGYNLTINDRKTISQMMTFRHYKSQLRAPRGMHDDCALALMLAFHPLSDAGLFTQDSQPRSPVLVYSQF
mgnify:CR=1 FL=1